MLLKTLTPDPTTYDSLVHPWEHKAIVPPDDGSGISFRWHFPRGTLAPRMSGYELATFLLEHMPYIVPLLGNHPRVQAEFNAMYLLLATQPKLATDRLLPWIRSVTLHADDDEVVLSLFDQTPQASGPLYFDFGSC